MMIIPTGLANAGTYRIIVDHLGSPRFIINTVTGDAILEIDYDEWGNEQNLQFGTGVTRDIFPFGFAGGLYDEDTGLVRFGARDFYPEIGRWILKDRSRFLGGDSNLFIYSGNDPINFRDPTGKNAIAMGGAYGFSVGGPVGAAIGLGIGLGITYGIIKYNSFSDGQANTDSGENIPDLPDEIVGDNPRESSGKRTNADLPSDKFPDTVDELTGGKINPDGVCPNGVRVRQGKPGQGPRIDIPANGNKPPETIHFPPETPWPY